jgi:hypothetical protein
MVDYDRSIALLLLDGLRFTPRPLTPEQHEDLELALKYIVYDTANDRVERDIFRMMLDHGWRLTAPFDPGSLR